MTAKLEDSNTAPNIHWVIVNRLIYNKKVPAIPRLHVDGSSISTIAKKANLFNIFRLLYVQLLETIVYYLPFYIRPTPE